MIKGEFDRGRLQVRQISSSDSIAFKGFCERFFGKDLLEGFLGGKDPTDPENWEKFIKSSNYLMFGLFHQSKIIGTSSIMFRGDDEAIFTGIMIDQEYQRRGLADELHSVRRRYLNSINFDGSILADILPNNDASIRAAKRNGFQFNRLKEEGGITYMTFSLSL